MWYLTVYMTKTLLRNCRVFFANFFLTSTKLRYKLGKRNASICNYVLEVPANIRKILIYQGRIFINWTPCSVRDFTLVTRCFNWQQYGHAAKFCRKTSPTCYYCGESGHNIHTSSPPKLCDVYTFQEKMWRILYIRT